MAYSQPLNTNGWRDTGAVYLSASETLYGDAFNLASYEYTTFHIFANDDDAGGFANDSIKFYWFLQTGSPTIDSAGNRDTVWAQNSIVIDTLSADSLGKTHSTTIDGSGSYTLTLGGVDTSSVVGYATQSASVALPFDAFGRIGFTSVTGHGDSVYVKYQVVQRAAQRISR